MQVDCLSSIRDWLKRTWMEVVRLDLKKCNLFENLAQDRLEWRDRNSYIVDPNIVVTRFDDDEGFSQELGRYCLLVTLL